MKNCAYIAASLPKACAATGAQRPQDMIGYCSQCRSLAAGNNESIDAHSCVTAAQMATEHCKHAER